MKLTKIRFALFALVVGAVAVPSTAIADGWFSEMNDVKAVTLGDVLRSPRTYVDVEVRLKLYFNSTGDSYNPYFTRFTEEMYGNFSAWPINARLYEKRDFQRSYPLFFMQRFHSNVWGKMQNLNRMQSVEVLCSVREVFRGQPWIEVKTFRVVNEGLSTSDVKNVIAGDAYYLTGRYDEAAHRYGKVDKSDVSDAERAELYRKQGDAQYKAGNVSGAVDSYEEGLRAAPNSVVLQGNVAVAAAAAKHARLVKRGKAADQPLPEVAPQSVPVVKNSTNDVDEVIRILENPEDVKVETEKWRANLEKRAALELERRNGANVTAVKGDDEVAVEETEASADATETEDAAEADEAGNEVVEEEVAEETVDESDEGCGEMTEEVVEEEVTEEPVAEEVAEESSEETVEEPAEGCGDSEEVVEEESDEVEMNEEGEDAPVPEEDTAEEQSEETEASAEEVVEEEVVEEEVVEEAADETTEGCGEATEEVTEEATETEEEVVEEEVTEEVVDEPVEETTEGCGEATEEEVVEETVEEETVEVPEEEVVEEPVEEAADESGDSEVVEEEEVVVEEGSDEAVLDGSETNDTPAAVEVVDEDPRVVRVGEVSVRIPRLPFFGCDEVTMDDLRAVLEEILRNPES